MDLQGLAKTFDSLLKFLLQCLIRISWYFLDQVFHHIPKKLRMFLLEDKVNRILAIVIYYGTFCTHLKPSKFAISRALNEEKNLWVYNEYYQVVYR